MSFKLPVRWFSQVQFLSIVVVIEAVLVSIRYRPITTNVAAMEVVCGFLAIGCLAWGLLSWIENDDAPIEQDIEWASVVVAALFLLNLTLIVRLNYTQYKSLPHAWEAVSRGSHLQVGLLSIVAAGMSYNRRCITLVAIGTVIVQAVPVFMALASPNVTITRDTYAGLLTPAIDLGAQIPRFGAIAIAWWISSIGATKYESLVRRIKPC